MNPVTNTFCSQCNNALLCGKNPPEVKERIGRCFNSVSSRPHTPSTWLYNGRKQQNICKIDEHRLIPEYMQKHPERKKYILVEMGAGDFSWGKSIAKTINEYIVMKQLPNDISVTIISTRAEENKDDEYAICQELAYGDYRLPTKNCILLNLGLFKIENLFEAFSTKEAELKAKQAELESKLNCTIDIDLNVIGKVDFIFSAWTVRHFVDGPSALEQMCHCLRPGGMYFGDGFFFAYENQSVVPHPNYEEANRNMVKLLSDAKVDFVMNMCDEGRSLNHFVIKKGTNCVHFPLENKTLLKVGEAYCAYSMCIPQFKGDYIENDLFNMPKYYFQLYGNSKDLFNEIAPYYYDQNSRDSRAYFQPLLLDKQLENKCLAKAILAIDACGGYLGIVSGGYLKDAPDLNKEYLIGMNPPLLMNPLSLCIFRNNKRGFNMILEKDPDCFSYITSDGNTPLHIAAMYDKEGWFAGALIKALEINDSSMAPNKQGKTPLDLARENNNEKVVELLNNVNK